MMADVEDGVRKLLAGEVLPVPDTGLNSNSNDQQSPDRFVPICKRSVTYIVMAVLFDDRGRVLLIQEAKQSCHGKWYLPAGRVEPGENLIDGAQREVEEEAGYMFEPESFVHLAMEQSTWWRFTYVGKVSGGKLKTLAEKDEESLQANWFTLEQIRNGFVPLRAKDILPALAVAEKYHNQSMETRHPASSIVVQPHRYLLHRMLVFQQSQDGIVEVLCYKKDGFYIPCCDIHPGTFSVTDTVQYLALQVFGVSSKDCEKLLTLRGLVSVEHCGIPAREHDGLCLTSAVIINQSNCDGKRWTIKNKNYEWISIGDESLRHEIEKRIFLNNLLIPLNICI